MFAFMTQFAAGCSQATVNGETFCTDLPQAAASSSNVQNLVHIVVGTLAAIAVLIIVISALNIVTAGGDASKVAKARGAIIFALVGIVIVVLADAIVSIILRRL